MMSCRLWPGSAMYGLYKSRITEYHPKVTDSVSGSIVHYTPFANSPAVTTEEVMGCTPGSIGVCI